VWISRTGRLSGEERKKALQWEEMYQTWLEETRKKPVIEILNEVEEKTGLSKAELAVALSDHFAVLIQRGAQEDLGEVFETYLSLLENLYKSFTVFFEPYVEKGIFQFRALEYSRRLPFVLFDNKKNYMENTGVPEYMAGHYDLEKGLLFTYRSDNPAEMEAILHEACHMITDFTCMQRKFSIQEKLEMFYPWWNEGLAEYFSGFERKEDGSFLPGRPSRIRLKTAKNLFFKVPDSANFKTIMQISNGETHRETYKAFPYVYAGGWSIIYFLATYKRGLYREDLIRFLSSAFQGKGTYDDFKKIFKEHNLSAMEKQWKRYTLHLVLGK